MIDPNQSSPTLRPQGSDKASTLALSLAQAERAIHEFAAGQLDAIVDADGHAHLLRPAQEHLRESESRLNAILESMADGVAVIDQCGLIIAQNRASTRMLGYEPGELLGTSFFGLIDAGELLQFYAAFFDVIEGLRANARAEFHLRAQDGSYRLIEATVAKLHGVAGSANVVTCRQAIRDEATNERRLQAIIDSAADVIAVVSRGGTIVSYSQSVRRLLGYEPEALVGKNIFELIYGGDLSPLYIAFFNVVEGLAKSATAQFHHPTRNGSYRLIEVAVGRMVVNDSTSAVLSMRSVETLRLPLVESPLPEAVAVPVVRAKDRFLAMIAHELRTPLTPVLLGVAELEEDERFAEARVILAMIRRNITVQTRLIEELTDFALVGEHKVRLRLETIDLHEALRFVLEICGSEIADAKIEMRLDLRATASGVIADSVRLQQVMWNLLKNAIKFSSPGSSISITTLDGPPGQLTIAFIDQGIGIEAPLLSRIFDAFQQGSLSEQRVRGGLGLGLFIAKGLTEAQGGSLTVLSEGRGQGATFRLTLPKAPTDKSIPPTETDSQFFHPARHPLPS